jgi:8-oxo-dGTP diphosphatase
MEMPEEEKVLLHATLCFPIRDGKVLMGRKTGKIGKGCRNGYGGGIEAGEKPKRAAPRELIEESGLIAEPSDLNKVAIVHFHNEKSDGGRFTCEVHVYLLYEWTGEPKETEEMTDPTWFDIDRLPFHEMMPADKEWLPHIFTGKKFIAEAYLGPFQRTLLSDVKITEVDSFPEE